MMKMNRFTLFVLLIIIFITPVHGAWWNDSYHSAYNQKISNGVRPYVLTLNITNTSGLSNTTHINLSSPCSAPACQDIRFVLDNTSELGYWREWNSTSSEYGKYYVNITGNGDVQIYYNSSNHTDGANGNKTFALFDDFSDKPDASKLAGDRQGYPTWGIISGTWTATDGYLKTSTDQAKITTNLSSPSVGRQYEFHVRNPSASGSLFWMTAFSHVVSTPAGQGYEFYFNGFYRILENQSILSSTAHATDTAWHWIHITRDENGVFKLYENGSYINTANDMSMTYQKFFGVWQQGAALEGNIDTIREYPYVSNMPVWSSTWTYMEKTSPILPKSTIWMNNSCGFDTFVNNTDLAENQRLQSNIYYSNESEILLFVWYSSASDTANMKIFIDGQTFYDDDVIYDQTGKYGSTSIIVPKGSRYTAEIQGYSTYSWKEYPRYMNISGCVYPSENNTLNQTVINQVYPVLIILIGLIYFYYQKIKRLKQLNN